MVSVSASGRSITARFSIPHPDIDWFEIISENYMVPGGQPLRMLDRIVERYPVVMHGVSLSIASTTPFDRDYLTGSESPGRPREPQMDFRSSRAGLASTASICMTCFPFPIPRRRFPTSSRASIEVQDFLGRRIVIENVSSYIEYDCSEMSEWDFVAEVARRADCWLLLDVNNVFVSGVNHDFNTQQFS